LKKVTEPELRTDEHIQREVWMANRTTTEALVTSITIWHISQLCRVARN